MKELLTIFLLEACILVLSAIEVSGSNLSDSVLHNDTVADGKFFMQPSTGWQASARAPVISSSSRTTEAYSYLLSWKPNAVLTDIQCYKIRYKKESAPTWIYRTVAANASQLRLNQLDSSSLYEVEMIRLSRDDEVSQLAMSSFRTGSSRMKNTNSTLEMPSRHSPVENKKSNKTTNAKVPGAPSVPFLTKTSATSVSLTWLPRSNGGSPITGYKVQMRAIGRKRSRWKTKTSLRADTKSYRVTGLKRDMSYKFRVVATNKLGDSPPSQAAMRNAESDPELGSPPLIRDVELLNGSLLVHWTYEDVDPAEFQGFIVKYTVGSKRKRERIKNSHASSFEIISPVHKEDYSVKVQAYNRKKVSPESDPIKFNIIRNHALKKDIVSFSGSFHVGSHYDNYNKVDGQPGGSSNTPSYNDKVKEKSSRRDVAIIIVASVMFVVILLLLSSCVFYHKQKKKGRKRRTARSEKEPSTLCTKLFGASCYRKNTDPTPNSPPQSSAPHCSCYSGASSPLRTNGSCLASNRTSLSHNAAPDSNLVPCSRVPGNMYAVYYDYSPGRPPPPCLATPGVPLCWVRGEGEFCHIIPHSSRPKAIDDVSPDLSGAGSLRSGTASSRTGAGSVRTVASKSVTPASTASPANELEVDPEQVCLVEKVPQHSEET